MGAKASRAASRHSVAVGPASCKPKRRGSRHGGDLAPDCAIFSLAREIARQWVGSKANHPCWINLTRCCIQAFMRFARQRFGRWGGLSAALAFLALALQLLFPAGFMADTSGASAHGIPIVICTAQGRITTAWDGSLGHDSKKAPAKSMATCAFAGHAAASPPPVPRAIPVAVAFPIQPLARRVYERFPRPRPAAPPPQAIGPPLQV